MKSNIEVTGITMIENGWRLEYVNVERNGSIEELIIELRAGCKTKVYSDSASILEVELPHDKLEKYLENYIPGDPPISSAA